MPTDQIICAAEVAPGKACGHGFNLHRLTRDGSDSHPFIPGRTCQTCGGRGYHEFREEVEGTEGGYSVTRWRCRCIGGVERIEGGE